MKNVKAIAISSEERVVNKPFTEQEIAGKKESYIADLLKLHSIENELEGVKLEYKTKMDPIKKEMGNLLAEIKSGYSSELATVYLVDNQDDGVMEYYTEDGQMVFSRPLLPQEKQLHLIKGVM